MSSRPKHPNKEIEAAVAYAESKGWKWKKANGHAWGVLLCLYNSNSCRNGEFCRMSVWSTPKNPQNFAKNLIQKIDGCVVLDEKEGETK
jgi:hypothetical protein